MNVADRVDAPVPRSHGNRAGGGSWRTRRDVAPLGRVPVPSAARRGRLIALTLYVASEDDYRRGGISRWHAYDARGLTVAAVATALAAAAALIGAAGRRRAGLAIIGFLASSAAFALCFAAFLANSLN
jgi:hypothetical protein